MILKRKMYDKMLTLKTELNGKKAFLIEGARRTAALMPAWEWHQ